MRDTFHADLMYPDTLDNRPWQTTGVALASAFIQSCLALLCRPGVPTDHAIGSGTREQLHPMFLTGPLSALDSIYARHCGVNGGPHLPLRSRPWQVHVVSQTNRNAVPCRINVWVKKPGHLRFYRSWFRLSACFYFLNRGRGFRVIN